MVDQIKEAAQKHAGQLVEIRRHLHAHPELSFQEHETSKYVERTLKEMGVEVQRMAQTGLVVLIKGKHPGPVVALRGDMDALPIVEKNKVPYCSTNRGVMHACGHDVHTTCVLGAAMILNGMKEELSGTVKLIFQPGEEKLPGGASIMIKDGALKNPAPASIFGQHVHPELEVGKVGFRAGKYMASCDEVYLTIQGRGGHGAMPHMNIDPILIAADTLLAMQQVVSRRSNPMVPTVLSFGRIEGLGATNVIPDEVEVAGTFRTFDEEWRMEAHGLIQRIAEETAKSYGGTCIVRIEKGYPFVYNDEALTQRARAAAVEYLGAENVVDLEMRATGEDFSYYSQAMPGSFHRLGVRNESKGIVHPVHSSHFDVDEACLSIGAGMMAWLAINELTRQQG
ncbi:MAG: M20 family metallopeptidase [Cryomorphaceae bacterium]